MPNISVNRKDLDKLLGRHPTDKELEAWLPLVKAEIKEVDAATGELRLELQDSNRPDLWCVEGIARQIRIKLNGRPDSYPYLRAAKSRPHQILVEQGLERVRPLIGGGARPGATVTPAGWAHPIPTPDKQHDPFSLPRPPGPIRLSLLPPTHYPAPYTLPRPPP